jgi:hypothetical protein
VVKPVKVTVGVNKVWSFLSRQLNSYEEAPRCTFLPFGTFRFPTSFAKNIFACETTCLTLCITFLMSIFLTLPFEEFSINSFWHRPSLEKFYFQKKRM